MSELNREYSTTFEGLDLRVTQFSNKKRLTNENLCCRDFTRVLGFSIHKYSKMQGRVRNLTVDNTYTLLTGLTKNNQFACE